MSEFEKMVEMFTLQQKLNDETNGIGWESGYTKQGKLINWKLCIYMELAELIDSFNWKHWKSIDIEPNWDNIKIEIVDVWHFVMSLALEEYKINKKGNINDIVYYTMDSQYFNQFLVEPISPSKDDTYMIINTIEHFVKDTLDEYGYDKLIDDFFEVALQCGVNIDILYKYYIGKNILNKFRQNHGYKSGEYIKIWDNKEDNEVMMELLEQKAYSAKDLYHELEKLYPNY